MRKLLHSFRFAVGDWWQSRGESRPLPDEDFQAVREASHTHGGRLSRSPSDAVLKQAAENNDNYLKSFGDK